LGSVPGGGVVGRVEAGSVGRVPGGGVVGRVEAGSVGSVPGGGVVGRAGCGTAIRPDGVVAAGSRGAAGGALATSSDAGSAELAADSDRSSRVGSRSKAGSRSDIAD
jgi:hypothetical protein